MKAISDNEIRKVEKILLPEGKSFLDANNERIEVIKEIENNLDVVACPGSGKTTVLLAKLLILADRMPFEVGGGICVLTHTNVAIDEIKARLGNSSSNLFTYPNFFGTIQSFVDKYLAIPALIKYYDIRPNSIDNDKANKKLLYLFKGLDIYRNKLHTYLWAQLYENVATLNKKDIITFFEINKDEENDFLDKMVNNEILEKETKTKYRLSRKANKTYIRKTLSDTKLINRFIEIKDEVERVISTEKEDKIKVFTLDYTKSTVTSNTKSFSFTSNSGNEFIKLKEKLFNEGILSYRDAFDLANRYIADYEQLQKSFSQRFKYVFVDEMQDTDYHQLAIIKGLFDKTDTITQYFGDPNQAIFNYVKKGKVWISGENNRRILYISDSKRFGNNIANLLDKIKIDNNIKIKGNEEVKSLKPHLIVFKTGEEEKVLEKFAEIIAENKDIWEPELEKQRKKPIYKAVGWVAKERRTKEIADNKLNIKSYFKDYERKTNKQKLTYDNLKYYLRKNDIADEKGVKVYSELIVSAFLQILEIAGKKNEIEIIRNGETETQKRHFTKSSFLKELKAKNKYNEFRQKIALWSKSIHFNNEKYHSETINAIRVYVENDFKEVFSFNLEKVQSFIDEPVEVNNQLVSDDKKTEFYYDENTGIEIEVGTVHSVKGETHTATLYFETYVDKGFESNRLNNYLFKEKNNSITKKTLKMIHVGFSRPTHLLCFAVNEERSKKFDSTLFEIEKI